MVCWDADKTVLLLPCRHLCLCEPCAGRMRAVAAAGAAEAAEEDDGDEAPRDGRLRCPMCREVVEQTMTCFS